MTRQIGGLSLAAPAGPPDTTAQEVAAGNDLEGVFINERLKAMRTIGRRDGILPEAQGQNRFRGYSITDRRPVRGMITRRAG
jgi:hypothetical protein